MKSRKDGRRGAWIDIHVVKVGDHGNVDGGVVHEVISYGDPLLPPKVCGGTHHDMHVAQEGIGRGWRLVAIQRCREPNQLGAIHFSCSTSAS